MIYYSCKPILKIAEEKKCPAIVICGGKGNGKTFSILQHYLEVFIKTGKVLRYIRRFRESITAKAIMDLMAPQKQNIINLTNGKYNSYYYYRSRFYLTRENEFGERVEKMNKPFMICSALNSVEGFTGADSGQCSAVFFDEFLSREKQLDDEFTSLMIFHNNCMRNRTEEFTPLVLVGNTVSRNSTLARDFGIDLYNIKKGEVTAVYNSKKVITALVEYCSVTDKMNDSGKNYYERYENDKIKMIYTGDWSIGNYPRISKRHISSSDILFTFYIKYSKTPLIVTLRQYKQFFFAYVDFYSKNSFDVILTTETTPLQPYIFNYYNHKIRAFHKLGLMILRKQVYFSCGECGEIFRDFLAIFTGCEQFRNVYK